MSSRFRANGFATRPPIGTAPVGALSPSDTSALSISLASPTTAGTYYYGACVDAVAGESDATNNCSTSVQVDVSEPQSGQGDPQTPQRRPDIAPLGVFLRSGTLDVSPGRSFTFRSWVRNHGDAESAATTLGFYRSVKRGIEPTDTLVGSVSVEPLALGGPRRQRCGTNARRPAQLSKVSHHLPGDPSLRCPSVRSPTGTGW